MYLDLRTCYLKDLLVIPELLTSSIVYVAVPVHVCVYRTSVPPKQDASEAVPAIEQGSIMEQSVVPAPPV